MKSAETSDFQKIVLGHYKTNGRDLPWRKSITPYKILVSELMLQQTQVDRVIPKYSTFIKKYPSFRALSSATLVDVLTLWIGLGYNRRAKFLFETAKVVSSQKNGRLPATVADLCALPGIGPYTAGAVVAFAYNKPTVFIETNIRTVYLHHFFKNKDRVHDNDIFPLIEKTLYKQNPRLWYWALMDYGTFLKKTNPNPSRKSSHHAKQSRFNGSDRQLRGKIIKLLLDQSLTDSELQESFTDESTKKLERAVNSLIKDQMITKSRNLYKIKTA